VSTYGEIRVRKLPPNSKYGSKAVVSVDTHVSDESLEISQKWDESTRLLQVSVPRQASVSENDNCISLEITIWLPDQASLSKLSVGATVLSLRVFDDVNVKVTGPVELTSMSGDVYLPNFDLDSPVSSMTHTLDSRHLTVETVSGNIQGIYPLYDYLKLGSQSGDINAGVFPQPVLASEPAPADLEVSTASGQIQVNLPFQKYGYTPPARDYVTNVGSVSGDISGNFFLGSAAKFKSSSGDITARVLPVIQHSPSTDPDDAPTTRFETWSLSGDHDLQILDPVFISLLPSAQPAYPDQPNPPNLASPTTIPSNNHSKDSSPEHFIPIGDDDPYRDILTPELNEDVILDDIFAAKMVKRRRAAVATRWRTLTASHESGSADIKIRYPQSFEGTVSGSTISGSIKADGKDLKIIKYKNGFVKKELLAGKGVSGQGEGSSVSMTSISGSLKVLVGEEL
jgi:hypothetical protein